MIPVFILSGVLAVLGFVDDPPAAIVDSAEVETTIDEAELAVAVCTEVETTTDEAELTVAVCTEQETTDNAELAVTVCTEVETIDEAELAVAVCTIFIKFSIWELSLIDSTTPCKPSSPERTLQLGFPESCTD